METTQDTGTPSVVVALGQRLISEMQFGLNMCVPDPTLGEAQSKTWEPSKEQIAEQEWVREYLKEAGCVLAEDIERLGCTGVAAHEFAVNVAGTEASRMNALRLGARLRLGLAGSGVGLPCFVPDTRFCLIHNTIGGLEPRQEQRHAEFVNTISRPLTPEEEAKTAVMRRARQLKSVGEVNDFIAGKSPLDVGEAAEENATPSSVPDVQRLADVQLTAWTCPEHKETVWSCRYCLAQAIVEGPLAPVTLVASHAKHTVDGKMVMPLESEFRRGDERGVDVVLKEFADERSVMADVWARVATFRLKLARD